MKSTATGTTLDLINAAEAARAAFDQATAAYDATVKQAAAAVQAAAQVLRDAAAAMQAANQALHDDLDANGPAVVIDQTTTPMTVTLYTAADPDSYGTQVIRTAG